MKSQNTAKNTYAAIDIGTNSAHLVVATVEDSGVINILDTDKIELRLGEALDESNRILPEAIDRTVNAVKNLKEIAKTYNPHYRCVATHAIREAKNRNDLINRVFEETNIKIEIIDGIEEARLVALGMKFGLSTGDDSFLGVDIGGGSTELIVSSANKIDFITSIKLGAVVLTDQLLTKDKPSSKDVRKLNEYIRNQLAPLKSDLDQIVFSKAIMSSGTAKAIATIDSTTKNGKEIEDISGYEISSQAVEKLNKGLQSLKSPKKIRQEYNVESRRSEILMAGCSILAGVTNLFNVKKWTVSTYGLREGLVIDTYRREANARSEFDTGEDWSNVRWQNVKHLGRKFGVDENQATRVLDLSMQIYDQLEPNPGEKIGLTNHLSDRDILGFSAWLHECGKYISFPKYHKHSKYLILNSRMMGFTQEEREFIGLISRFHRKGLANPARRDCRFLPHQKLRQVNFLSGILRFSTILCRTRQNLITNIKIDVERNCRIFVLQHDIGKSPDAEIHRLLREKKEIEKSLGIPIDIFLEIEDGSTESDI